MSTTYPEAPHLPGGSIPRLHDVLSRLLGENDRHIDALLKLGDEGKQALLFIHNLYFGDGSNKGEEYYEAMVQVGHRHPRQERLSAVVSMGSEELLIEVAMSLGFNQGGRT